MIEAKEAEMKAHLDSDAKHAKVRPTLHNPRLPASPPPLPAQSLTHNPLALTSFKIVELTERLAEVDTALSTTTQSHMALQHDHLRLRQEAEDLRGSRDSVALKVGSHLSRPHYPSPTVHPTPSPPSQPSRDPQTHTHTRVHVRTHARAKR